MGEFSPRVTESDWDAPSGTFAAHRDTQMRQRTRTWGARWGDRDAMTGRFEDMAGVAMMDANHAMTGRFKDIMMAGVAMTMTKLHYELTEPDSERPLLKCEREGTFSLVVKPSSLNQS